LIPGEMTRQDALARGLETQRGALIAEVSPLTKAGNSGIKAGDIIVAVNGIPIATRTDFLAKLISTPIGRELTLDVATETGRREFKLPVVAYTAMPHAEAAPASVASLKGVSVGLILPGFPAFGRTRGVRVLKLEDGPLHSLGLKPDDVITQVNGSRIDTPAELFAEARGHAGQLRLDVTRGERKGVVFVDAQPSGTASGGK